MFLNRTDDIRTKAHFVSFLKALRSSVTGRNHLKELNLLVAPQAAKGMTNEILATCFSFSKCSSALENLKRLFWRDTEVELMLRITWQIRVNPHLMAAARQALSAFRGAPAAQLRLANSGGAVPQFGPCWPSVSVAPARSCRCRPRPLAPPCPAWCQSRWSSLSVRPRRCQTHSWRMYYDQKKKVLYFIS